MDKMWGDRSTKSGVETSERAALFRDGNYGMFMHWGLYSHLGGQWKDKTFYGIGEWILRQMEIPRDQYMGLAREFNPSEFNARDIVRVAKEAGMKWIIITSKHHEGFAMFKSRHPFNIVDATPFARDPMKELADECRAAGLGFGFYYSHFQDWTAPGGNGGPDKNDDGSAASFDQYFKEKCYPQVDEICSNYGELAYVWFDTPGNMPIEHVKALAELVGRKQPNAMLCSRIGHGMGDYTSLGDMEVPLVNHEGLWETPDTTNDSWSYAWYDQNWKDPKTILHRLVSTVGRGGTYLLNVGPDGKGRIPAKAAEYLVEAGKWIKKHPQVIYNASPSPWGHAHPWGDVTRNGNTLSLVVFDWPADRRICLPGVDGKARSATLLTADGSEKPVAINKSGDWTILDASQVADAASTSAIASVIKLTFDTPPAIDKTFGIHPNIASQFACELANVTNAGKKSIHWMEKFGEWKTTNQVSDWQPGGMAEWDVNVARAGDYHVSLSYKGEGRPVWSVTTSEGVKIQNQQAASHVYKSYHTGVLTFSKPGKHKVSVSLVEGDGSKASLEAIIFTPVR
jgi:alpha-L-fucosidase